MLNKLNHILHRIPDNDLFLESKNFPPNNSFIFLGKETHDLWLRIMALIDMERVTED